MQDIIKHLWVEMSSSYFNSQSLLINSFVLSHHAYPNTFISKPYHLENLRQERTICVFLSQMLFFLL